MVAAAQSLLETSSMNLGVYSYSSAGRALCIGRESVADLARVLGIPAKRVELNGRAKGLSEADMELLRWRLRPLSKKEVK
jgi:hypothetical protein